MIYPAIHFSITTNCNMTCPDCIYGMRFRPANHSPVKELLEDVMFFRDLKELTITGGEATTHPNLDAIVFGIRKLLPEIEIRIETNGLLYAKWSALFKEFSLINVTHYTKDSWDGCLDNTKVVELIKSNHDQVRVMPAKHLTLGPGKGSAPCGRRLRPHYSHRVVYGCCVGAGIKGAIGVPLSEDWQQKVWDTMLPCGSCPFGEPA